MADKTADPILTAVFVDYDNIYLSLKRRSEDAAKRFAKDAVNWIKDIESGRLMTATNSPLVDRPRRIVLNRCYGNPVPRRNQNDNSTDMNSFPFVRHHFLRAGFEVIDCPPLTAQLKNSSDIRMVMDVRDFLNHDTRFEEFVILSGDADFTPVLHRLRAHARRTVIFANDYTAAPYTAISDGEVKESSLLAVLLEGKIAAPAVQPVELQAEPQQAAVVVAPSIERQRAEILTAVTMAVRSAGGPVPLEALAERTTRALGHERTVATGWAGAGSFLELLRSGLPEDLRLTDQPPYLAFEAKRGIAQPQQMPQQQPQLQQAAPVARQIEMRERSEPSFSAPEQVREPMLQSPPPRIAAAPPQPQHQPQAVHQPAPQPMQQAAPQSIQPQQMQQQVPQQVAPRPQMPRVAPAMAPVPVAPAPQQRQQDVATAIQQSIARIHDACQAPPLSPPEYRALFEIMAKEIGEAGLQGVQTLNNINARAQEVGISLSRDDVRFVMEVVSEADPWFEQGATANLFAGRFRNFVVARCRSQGLSLSSDELDLIEAWFAGTGQQIVPQNIRVPAGSTAGAQPRQPAAQPQHSNGSAATGQPNHGQNTNGLWGGHQPSLSDEQADEDFPKILRTRLRG